MNKDLLMVLVVIFLAGCSTTNLHDTGVVGLKTVTIDVRNYGSTPLELRHAAIYSLLHNNWDIVNHTNEYIDAEYEGYSGFHVVFIEDAVVVQLEGSGGYPHHYPKGWLRNFKKLFLKKIREQYHGRKASELLIKAEKI